MLRRLFAGIHAASPACFSTSLSVDQAVSNLRAATSSSIFELLFKESASGKVTAQKVVLQHNVPFMGNSFKPYFVGRFETEDGRTTLRGAFKLHWYVRTFMTFWFGFCILWTAIAFVIALSKPIEHGFFPIFGTGLIFFGVGTGMIFFGVGMVKWGKWLSRNDEQYLSNIIKTALARSAA